MPTHARIVFFIWSGRWGSSYRPVREPTALCLGIGGLAFSLRLCRSQIRQHHFRLATEAPEADFSHLPEGVPSI